ncbi:hypothetical protein [Kamptonema formosum]|uniref:hypothetical protein n=1 Tax=Kamptonema formosum TaxID=331992 RepID=UPI0005C53E3D|nr:hypothetical protein [Oscillatoria sp. PCC 10802]
MDQDFPNQRLDRFGVIPYTFLEDFRSKDPSTRRYLLNSMTLFASISSEQQHQILNDLIQSELLNLAAQSKKYLQDRIADAFNKFCISKNLGENEIAEYCYSYYVSSGILPDNMTADSLKKLGDFILGIELLKSIFLMSFVEQQRFFELQGNYSSQAVLFYRYIKPIRSKLIKEKVVNRDIIGNYYYSRPWVKEMELVDYIFELFNLESILYLGQTAKNLTFEKEYIYKSHEPG